MNRIHKLSDLVANQIAAGEVIERPASVVKELLENALDAGADAISIEIGFGGLNQVKVTDNGVGICADDLPLAVAAHATSKISKLNDLYAISSMGFRGEALASIASVSRLSISSRPTAQEHAMMLHVDGETMNVSPCARSQGTSIDVRDLFFNAPVRKKFLKTERHEYQAIEVIVKRFALSAPSVTLSLKHNDKPVLVLPAATCEQTTLLRIKKLLGSAFVDQAIYLDVERAGMRLHGWISGHEYQRSQRDQQWIYLNRRMVKDKLLNHALKQAYEGVLHHGRHPSCVLYLTIEADQVDVNVHPTKHEVRFQQPRLVHDLMSSQILVALASKNVPDVVIPMEKSSPSAIREIQLDYQPVSVHAPKLGKDLGFPWFILNPHFAIIQIHEASWLFNVDALQQHRLQNDLIFPLTARPLLVPVSYPIEQEKYVFIEQILPSLVELGIHCDFASDVRLMVRTIPQLLPSVDIQRFLQTITNTTPTLPGLLIHLLVCQSFDARQLSVEEKAELTTYVQKLCDPTVLKGATTCAFGRRLDITTCRSFLHD